MAGCTLHTFANTLAEGSSTAVIVPHLKIRVMLCADWPRCEPCEWQVAPSWQKALRPLRMGLPDPHSLVLQREDLHLASSTCEAVGSFYSLI